MKTLKLHHFILAFSLFLTSCASVKYLGDTYPASTNTDVYYDAKDIKQDYKVIGHLTVETGGNVNDVKNEFVTKAKAIGADGIIILQTTGPNDKEIARADAIKYRK